MPHPGFEPKPGQIDDTHARRAPVLNCIVRFGDKILIVRRNSTMHFHPGVWNGVSGFLDEIGKTLEDKVREELREELGIDEDDIVSITEGEVVEQEDATYGKTWIVHPVLVDVNSDVVELDWEAEEHAWVHPHQVWDFDLLPGFDDVITTFFPHH
jgi:isopentenyldiphosphate isomerase